MPIRVLVSLSMRVRFSTQSRSVVVTPRRTVKPLRYRSRWLGGYDTDPRRTLQGSDNLSAHHPRGRATGLSRARNVLPEGRTPIALCRFDATSRNWDRRHRHLSLRPMSQPGIHLQREDQFACLLLDRSETPLGLTTSKAEDTIIEIATIERSTQIHISLFYGRSSVGQFR